MKTAPGQFSNSDMSYDTKAQKNRLEVRAEGAADSPKGTGAELPCGAALSTLVLEPVEEEQPEPAADTERQLPDSDD